MNIRKVLCLAGCAGIFLGTLYAFQRPFREYPGVEYSGMPLPPDWQQKTEWAFARLMYPPGFNDGYRGRDDGDEVYNWPWLYAVQVGEWGITDAQAKKLRDYLLRGGFFMADDFHGDLE